MKTVYKPWGKEIWLELNDKYCYKRIHINAGTKTSYQYHEYKLETNYIIKGTAEVWLENDAGIIEKNIMEAGEFFTVHPPKKHRVTLSLLKYLSPNAIPVPNGICPPTIP